MVKLIFILKAYSCDISVLMVHFVLCWQTYKLLKLMSMLKLSMMTLGR